MVAGNLSIRDFSQFRSASRELWLALTPRYRKLCLEDIGGLTALQWAAVRGHVELVELAISNGAEIDKSLRGMLDRTAPNMSDRPHYVCQLADRFALFDDEATFRTPLYLAACSGQLGAIKVLLKLGASVQCFGEIDTPAHISAHRGDVDCMRAFIGARFDINTRGLRDRTILHAAIRGGVEMITYLLEQAGGETLVNAKDSLQHTPLHWVSDSFYVEDKRKVITELLLQHGADIHARGYWGDTPAHRVARLGDVDTMHLLIAAGIDFHARGYEGRTILHCAVRGRNGVLEYLLGQEGGRRIVHIRDNHGMTPLEYAVEWRATEAVELLEEWGINT